MGTRLSVTARPVISAKAGADRYPIIVGQPLSVSRGWRGDQDRVALAQVRQAGDDEGARGLRHGKNRAGRAGQ